MFRRSLITICAVFYLIYFATTAHAQLPQISNGLSYLASSQNSDGTWDSSTSQVENTAATVSVLETLSLLNQTTSSSYSTGASWLQGQSPQTVDYIAERVLALKLTDGSVNALIPMRDPLTGAWGGYDGYDINFLDISFALQALKTANYADSTVLNPALAYLTGSQNSDGGWGFYQGDDSNVYMTAVVSATLQQFPQMSTIATAVSKATAYLLAHQNSDGGFGGSFSTVYETALAYSSLVAVSTNQAALGSAVNFLTTSQSANGSWNDDPYSTALALKALYLSENRPSPPPPPPAGGKISGSVIDSASLKKVSGVAVVLASNNLINAVTDATGAFTLNDVPAGSQNVNLTLSGYAPATATAAVTVNSISNIGTIAMVSSYSTGTIAGTMADSTGTPLSGVAISVSGAWSGSATTGADGSFAFTYVTLGSITLSATKPGYQTFTGQGTVYARTVLNFSPRLSTTPPQGITGKLVGRVVDSYWGLPIGHLPEEPGVKVKLPGGISVSPDDNGYFTIQGLAPNTYNVLVGMDGYATQAFRAAITAGVTSDVGTIRLEISMTKMALTGKVTDAVTGASIPAAEVTVVGNGNLTGRADFSGTYAIAGIDYPSQFSLKTAAAGYADRSFLIRSSLWTQTLDIALTPLVTQESLTGMVIDASNGQPLAGVALTVIGNPAGSATTKNDGTFSFSGLPSGGQQITLSLAGYSQRTMTTAVAAGIVNNVGKIGLSVNPLPASIQGTVWDRPANAPFAGVEILATGGGSWLAVTAADGTFRVDNVIPGTVTVDTGTVPKAGYFKTSFTGMLAPGGILVFNPVLYTSLPVVASVGVQTDKPVYIKSDTVGIAVNLQNTQGLDYAATMHVRVTDPTGAVAYDTNQAVSLLADSTIFQNVSFALPLTAPMGNYKVTAELYDASGVMLGAGAKSFGVATSQISVTPALPTALAAGDNTVSFTLLNTGSVAVSSGVLSLTLNDPDGEPVWTGSPTFGLGTGESKTVAATVTIPALKFGTYTLSYAESDETTAGPVTKLSLPNSIAIASLFDNNSHRIRQTAGLTVTVNNTGSFNLDPTGAGIAVTVSVSDAGYTETKTLSTAPALGSAAGSSLLYSFAIPETMTAGQHPATVTVTLPSGSTTVQRTQMAILESALSLSSLQGTYTAGGTIPLTISNSGGVDTSVQYKLSLYDAKSALISEKSSTGIAVAGSTFSPVLAIPAGAVDGSYNLVVDYQDQKTGKEVIVPNAIVINGVKGALQVQTDKLTYLMPENITGSSTVTNNGTVPLSNGNLHLQILTAAGSQMEKKWTTRADFQSGVRNGVDTYGVNDSIVPDDYFDGTALDTTKWSSSGNVSIQSGTLFFDTTQGLVSSGASGTYSLEGDFDVQADFSSNNSNSWVGAQFYVGSGASWVNVGNYLVGYGSQVVINGVEQSYLVAGNHANSGRFRIARTASTVVTYYWSGTTWIESNRSTSPVLSAPCHVGMGIYRDSSTGGASAAFDNFKVNAGRISKVDTTPDSVRLLPLNDNFDDGIINADRWSVRSSGSVVTQEANGALVTADTQTGTQSYANVAGHFPLAGDFDISVDWKTPMAPASGNWSSIFQISNVDQNTAPDNNLVGNALQIKRAYITGLGHVYQIGHYNGNTWDSLSSPVTTGDTAGRFRIKRVGSNVTAWYWNSTLTRWEWNGNTAGYTSNSAWSTPSYVQMETVNDVPNLPAAETDWNNFQISSGVPYLGNGTIRLQQDAGQTSNWQTISWNSAQPLGTSIKFRTRTAGSQADLASAGWSDYYQTSGSSITSPKGHWIEVEATLATTNLAVTPVLNDITVTYSTNPGDIIWQTDVPASLAAGALSNLSNTIGTLGAAGKYYLQGTLTSSTGQTVATAEYPFYVEQGNIQLFLAPDKKIYRPGEAVTISGEVRNLSSTTATALALQVKGGSGGTLYTESFDLDANARHPFTFIKTAETDGVYGLSGFVSQNAVTMATIADRYTTSTPAVTATMTAPDTAGIAPFAVSLSLSNAGKVGAFTNVQVTDDSGAVIDTQLVALNAGETRLLQYTRQTSGPVTYTAAMTGDLKLTLAKTVGYLAPPSAVTTSISAKIVADRISYNPNQQAMLTATATAGSAAENLSALITVTNSQGQALYSAIAGIPALLESQAVTVNKQWNTGTSPAGTYLVTLQITDGTGTVVAKSTCDLVINIPVNPGALLKGSIVVDKQTILTGDQVKVSYSVTNAGNIDLANVALSVLTVNMADQTVYNTIIDQAALAIGASHSNSGSIGTQGYSAKDYLVVVRATIAGVEETLAGAYFRVEGAPSAPALIGPVNGSDVETFTPQLSISNAADPNDDKLSYEFEVYSDSSLTGLVASGTVPETAGSTTWVVPNLLTENKTFFWRARAYDGTLYGPWTAQYSFRVNTVNDAPTPPTISTPADGASVDVFTPVLTVGNASDPDSSNLTYNFDVALDSDFTRIVATTKGIAAGPGATSWTVPVDLQENGWYYWRAQADDWLIEGPWAAGRFFVNTTNQAPSKPVITAPAGAATVAALTADVVAANSSDPDSPQLTYYFEADTVPSFDSANVIRSGGHAPGEGATHWALTGLQDNTRYYLRVNVSDGSAESGWSDVTTFFANTVNDPPASPQVANPSNGAGVNVFTPSMSVFNATDPDHDSLSYDFELYADAALTSLVDRSGAIPETPEITGWVASVTLVENQTYYWRSRAFDGALYSDWMPTASFLVNTANDAPGAPKIQAPSDGGSVTTLTPTFAVKNAADPDSDSLTYEFEIYNGATLVAAASVVPGDLSGITSWTSDSALSDDTVYQWRARAFDGDNYGPWTQMAAFTVHLPKEEMSAVINFDPNTLNRSSKGSWVTVYIELPAGYSAANIDVSSIRLQGVVPAESKPYAIGDYNRNGVADLMVKFKRSEVLNLLADGDRVPVHVTGKVGNVVFDGVDIIRVTRQ